MPANCIRGFLNIFDYYSSGVETLIFRIVNEVFLSFFSVRILIEWNLNTSRTFTEGYKFCGVRYIINNRSVEMYEAKFDQSTSRARYTDKQPLL